MSNHIDGVNEAIEHADKIRSLLVQLRADPPADAVTLLRMQCRVLRSALNKDLQELSNFEFRFELGR